MECYNKAIEKNPDDKEAWFLKGSVLRSMRREEEALECYNKFIKINPHDEKANKEL